MSETNLLTIRDVAERLNITRPTVYKFLHRYPDFPRPIKLSVKATRFRASEIERWVESRQAKAA